MFYGTISPLAVGKKRPLNPNLSASEEKKGAYSIDQSRLNPLNSSVSPFYAAIMLLTC